MSLIADLVAYETTAIIVMAAALRARLIWRERPAIGWDPEQLRWRSARLIYKERRWR